MLSVALQDRSSRWLLIGSLALNLFFIGTLGALALRHYVMPAQPAATERPRTAAARIERMAAPLTPADAEKLRRRSARERPGRGCACRAQPCIPAHQAALRKSLIRQLRRARGGARDAAATAGDAESIWRRPARCRRKAAQNADWPAPRKILIERDETQVPVRETRRATTTDRAGERGACSRSRRCCPGCMLTVDTGRAVVDTPPKYRAAAGARRAPGRQGCGGFTPAS